MPDPRRLFEQFTAEYRRRGEADPRDYLAQVEGVDEAELAALIERFLLSVPRRDWDEASFQGSAAARAVARAGIPPEAADGGWPELLPTLRNRARLTRRTVVERLAAALGHPDREERVAAYYHRMEQGRLDPAGVSSAVLAALAGILGSTADALRRAGGAGERPGAGGEVFARRGAPADGEPPAPTDPPAAGDPAAPTVPGPASPRAGAAEPDELDRLFTGGG